MRSASGLPTSRMRSGSVPGTDRYSATSPSVARVSRLPVGAEKAGTVINGKLTVVNYHAWEMHV